MITLKQYLEAVDYQITDSDSNYLTHVMNLDYWDGKENGVAASVCYDTENQQVIYATVCDYSKNKAYRLSSNLAPEYDSDEYAYDEVKWIVLETDNDFLTKLKAIVNYQPYDTTIEIEIDLTDKEQLTLMRMAHEVNMTVNEYVEDILIRYIRDYEFTNGMFDDYDPNEEWVWNDSTYEPISNKLQAPLEGDYLKFSLDENVTSSR